MDGNCNIITEILLVIGYTKSNIIAVTTYCPALLKMHNTHIKQT